MKKTLLTFSLADPSEIYESRVVFVDGKKKSGADANGNSRKPEEDDAREKTEEQTRSRIDELLKESTSMDLGVSEKKELEELRSKGASAAQKSKIREILQGENKKPFDELISKKSGVPTSEHDWKILTSLPFAVVVQRLKGAKLAKYLRWLGQSQQKGFHRGSKILAREYMREEMSKDLIRKIPQKYREETTNIYNAALEGEVVDILEDTEGEVENAKASGDSLFIAQTKSARDRIGRLATHESEIDTETRIKNIIEPIEIAFGAGKIESLEENVRREFEDAEQAEKEMEEADRRAREVAYGEVQKHIAHEISHAIEKGAVALVEYANKLEKNLESFLKKVQEGAVDAWGHDDAKEFVARLLKSSFERIRTYGNLLTSDLTEQEVLDELHKTEVSPEDKSLVRAALGSFDRINAESPKIAVERDQILEKLWKDVLEPLRGESDEKRRVFLEKNVDVFEDFAIESEALEEAILKGDFPKSGSLRHVEIWAEKHGITLTEAAQVVANLAPANELVKATREEFVVSALEQSEIPPEKHGALLEYHSQTTDSLYRRFAGANGSVKKMLLLEMAEAMKTISSLFLDETLDGTNGDEIPPEELKTRGEEAGALVAKLKEILQNELPKVEELVTRIQSLRKKIEPVSEVADSELHRVQRLFEQAFVITQEADLDEISLQTPKSARTRVVDAFEGVTTLSQEMVTSLSPEQMSAQVSRACQKTSSRLETLEDISPKEAARKLETGEIELYPQSELLDRHRMLSALALNKESTFDEFEEFEDLKNFDGSPVLEILPDNKFQKGHGTGAKAIFIPEKGSFQIIVKESDWDKKDADMVTSLRHEMYHAFDNFLGYKPSDDLYDLVEALPNGKALLDEFSNKLSIKHLGYWDRIKMSRENRIKRELFAFLMAGETSQEMRDILSQIEDKLGENFPNFVSNLRQQLTHFDPRQIEASQAAARTAFAASSAHGFSFDKQKRKDAMGFQMKVEIDKVRKILETIQASDAQGKDEYVAGIESKIADFEKLMEEGISEEEYEDKYKDFVKLREDVTQQNLLIAENKEYSGNYFVELWDNTSLLSLADIGQLWSTGKEFIERRHQRKSKFRTGKVGKPLASIYKPLANEYDNKKEEAETEEVGNYEKGHSNKDAWEIMERVADVANQDELKACINTLAKRGQVDWYDRRIWRALEKFQRRVHFFETDADDTTALLVKLQRACGIIWDNDYFRDRYRENADAYNSQKQKYKNEVDNNLPVMDRMIQAMLRDKAAGKKVDSQRFEMYVEGAIDAGKSNPESVMWYLFQGMYLGIINIDRINYLDANKLNSFPPIEWFYNVRPTPDQIKSIAAMYPAGKNGSFEPPDDWMDWFWPNVMTNKFVRERVRKSVSQAADNWDHDWATTFFAVGDSNSAKIVTSLDNGNPRMPQTMYSNALLGQLSFITGLARNAEELSKDSLKDEVMRHLSFVTTYNGIVKGRVKSRSQEYFTLNKYELERPPRITSDAFYNEEKTPQDFIDRQDELLLAVDSDLFKFVKGGFEGDKKKIDEFIEQAKIKTGNKDIFGDVDPTTEMEVYDKLYNVIQGLFNKNPRLLEKVLSKARAIYKEDNEEWMRSKQMGEVRIGKIPHDRGKNWKDNEKGDIGKGWTKSKGMYAMD